MNIEKFQKLVTNLRDKTEYAIHTRNLKQALNHGLILRKFHRVIKFNQHAWLKPYIDMNTKLRQKAKNNFKKEFFKLRNNAVFGKTMENMRKHRNNKLVTTERTKKLVSIRTKLPYYNVFHRKVISNRNEKTQILMNKPVYLSLSILDLSKTVMYVFWYDYVKPKYGKNAKLSYMDTDSFIVHVKTDDI